VISLALQTIQYSVRVYTVGIYGQHTGMLIPSAFSGFVAIAIVQPSPVPTNKFSKGAPKHAANLKIKTHVTSSPDANHLRRKSERNYATTNCYCTIF